MWSSLSSNETEDDEHQMVHALQTLAHTVSQGPRASQKMRHASAGFKKKKPYTDAQIRQIVAKIKSGKIDLPDLSLDNNDDYFAVWALMDSGASINAINAAKIIPNAAVQKSKQTSYATANGGTLHNMGQVTTVCKHQEGHTRTYTWQNVNVDMPILSTASMNDDADQDGSVEYGKDHGVAKH